MSEQMTKQEVIETLETFKNDYTRENSAICRAIDFAVNALRRHTLESEVPHGHWIECCNELDKKCSCCNKVHGTIYEKEPFCPNCGAVMDGEVEWY